jgi:hypothetical protein
MQYGSRKLILIRTCDPALVFCIAYQGQCCMMTGTRHRHELSLGL